jgi:hypothetical protein
VTAAFEMKIRDRLLDDAVNELCPRTGNNASTSPGSRERTIRRYGGRFMDRMHGDNKFASEEDAIAALAPVAIWVFRWALRQLVIQAIRYLWKRMHVPEPVVVTAKMKKIGDYSM